MQVAYSVMGALNVQKGLHCGHAAAAHLVARHARHRDIQQHHVRQELGFAHHLECLRRGAHVQCMRNRNR